MNVAQKLDAAIRAVCPPIIGVSIGVLEDKLTWRIDFEEAATAQQRAAAQSALDAFDPTITRDDLAASYVDGTDRLQFAHLFDLENRVRALEGLGAVTVAQYRAALIARWKLLNPNGA